MSHTRNSERFLYCGILCGVLARGPHAPKKNRSLNKNGRERHQQSSNMSNVHLDLGQLVAVAQHFTLPTQMYILLLPEELRAGILENSAVNGGNLVLNMLALVCCCFRSVIAQQGRPALTRRVFLSGESMLKVAVIAQTWWRCVRGQKGSGSGVTDTRIASLAVGCPCITSLDLSGCYQITDAALISLAAVCTAITTLDLSYCWKIGDIGVQALATGCTALESLCITCCTEVTDEAIVHLAERCPGLTSLGLSFLKEVTAIGLQSLSEWCPQLTRLDLSFCLSRVKDPVLATKFPQLTYLDLSGCSQITNAGLANLATGCSVITSLNLSGCYQITDAGLISLAAGCTAITTLDLSECDRITDAGLIGLGAGCTATTSG